MLSGRRPGYQQPHAGTTDPLGAFPPDTRRLILNIRVFARSRVTRDGVRTDPFTGSDFGYRLTDDGPTIYSREDNGVDDGGIHNPDRRNKKIDSDDYVFWPPR